jgi:Xaa-Pro aminopeptidase
LYLRLRKTPEELELTRRAYIYLDRIHAFVRDLVLTRGTDLTDFDVGMAAKQFGTEMIMADVKPNGELHQAVGIHVDVMCHTGKTTGYGHPNQFLYSRIERGKPLQFAALLQIGGCGGELYRPYMIAPRTQHMEKLWTVSRDCCLLERDLLRKGARCSDIAWTIHQEQVKRGVQKYVYNRPAHGQGMEGHQPPYIALGDHSLLDTGMCLSAEPALFDPQNGVGVNFSDMFVVEPEGPPLQMSRLPWSEEWAWIKL